MNVPITPVINTHYNILAQLSWQYKAVRVCTLWGGGGSSLAFKNRGPTYDGNRYVEASHNHIIGLGFRV
jgi:hypothetical protein